MRSRAGTSSMNTIDLFREIMQKDLQERRRVCPEREGESPGLNGHHSRNRIANPDRVSDPAAIHGDYYGEGSISLRFSHRLTSFILF